MINRVRKIVGEIWERLDDKHKAVLYLICEKSNSNEWITQEGIAAHERWLGCHAKHEADFHNKRQSTLRNIRQIVRDIRIDYGVPIISGRAGYKLPATQEEAQQYLADLEREATAQAAAWFQTYRAVSDALNMTSSFFEEQRQKYES